MEITSKQNSIPWKRIAMAFAAACLLSSSLDAAQRGQRRVLTNEDIESAPAAVPAADPATTAGTATPAEGLSTPLADLKRAQAHQATLMDMYGEFTAKANEESNPTIKQRWTEMAACVGSLMSANQKNIVELEERLPPEQRSKPVDMWAQPDEPGVQSPPVQSDAQPQQ